MVKVRPVAAGDEKQVSAVRFSAFHGSVLSTYLHDPTDPHSRAIMAASIYMTTLRGSAQNLIAIDNSNKICGSITYVLQSHDGIPEHSSILGTLEAKLFAWEFWITHLPVWWQSRAQKAEFDRRRKLFSQCTAKGQTENVHDRGFKRFVYVQVLAVSPDHQGHGVGKALINHAKGLAKREGVPLYLESTKAGYGFYLHEEFEDSKNDTKLIDDGKVVWQAPGMLWYPKTLNKPIPQSQETR